MVKQSSKLNNFIIEGFSHLDSLTDLYKRNIGLINQLRLHSKRFMTEMSDIEESGLLNSNDPKSNFSLLLENILEFNSKMKSQTDEFTNRFSRALNYFENAIAEYKEQKSGLTHVLAIRKRMIFTLKILEKLKNKISGLEHMNNILFSIPSLWNGTDEEYTSELLLLHSTISRAEDKCRWLIKEIETLN